MQPSSERELAALAVALGARRVGGWSPAEEALVRGLGEPSADRLAAAKRAIGRGQDPLGDAFCALRSAAERRPMGATYTPAPIVDALLAWAEDRGHPARVVDPGTGSARFLVAAGRRFRRARLIGIECDPLAAVIGRAHVAAAGLEGRAEIVLADYREASLPAVEGRTLFVGNPPYVRHHGIKPRWKAWLAKTARRFGIDASGLAGLHAHFFLATAVHGRPGDLGAFITSAEWLDVNYGALVRKLFIGPLGGTALHLIEPTAQPFPDATTTGAIACFEIGAAPAAVSLRRLSSPKDLGRLEGGRAVPRERLHEATRWTPLTRPPRRVPAGFVELGELCRVHRGQVTGANAAWIVDGVQDVELPSSVLFPAVTRARELFEAGPVLADAAGLRRVIDLPVDLDALAETDRRRVLRFLRRLQMRGVDRGYIAAHRKAWWAVGLREPAPILATYMARRPPAFVRNRAAARHVNIAHGLYPREAMNAALLDALASHLSRGVTLGDGRTYAGGLTKFEPKEMERLLVPEPERLAEAAARAMAS